MKISEMIALLEDRKKQFGDLEIVVSTDYSHVPITEDDVYESLNNLVIDAD